MFRPRISAGTTDAELFSLQAGEWSFNPKSPPEWVEAYGARVEQYLLEHYHGGPGVTVTGGGMLAYQSIDERVGYIHIAGMAGFSDGEQGEDADVDAAGRAIDEALAALGDKEVLIIDVRVNGAPRGTQLVREFNPGPGSASIDYTLIAVGDTLYLVVGDSLWKSDAARPLYRPGSQSPLAVLLSPSTPARLPQQGPHPSYTSTTLNLLGFKLAGLVLVVRCHL